jgi:ribose transport system substrate-binding protein
MINAEKGGKKVKKVFLIAVMVILCVSLVACGGGGGNTPAPEPAAPAPAPEPEATAPAPEPEAPADTGGVLRVAVSLPPADNAWQAALKRSMEEAIAGDTEIEWTIKNATDDADQTNMLTTFKDGGYDLIACLPGDGTLQTAIMEEIFDAGIPTIIIDRDIESDKKTSFVAEDNYTCGQVAADFIGAWFDGQDGIKLVNLRSYAGIPIDVSRYTGFADTIVKYSNIENIGEGDGEFNQEAGYKAMSNLLAANSKIDVVFTHDDEAVSGAMAAIEEQGRTDIQLITGMGGTVSALNRIKADNTIQKACSSYFPRIGAQTVEVIREFFDKGSVPKDNVRDSTLITKDNVDQFMAYAYE